MCGYHKFGTLFVMDAAGAVLRVTARQYRIPDGTAPWDVHADSYSKLPEDWEYVTDDGRGLRLTKEGRYYFVDSREYVAWATPLFPSTR